MFFSFLFNISNNCAHNEELINTNRISVATNILFPEAKIVGENANANAEHKLAQNSIDIIIPVLFDLKAYIN